MAKNDIELSVGIKLDESQFDTEYKSLLDKVSESTKTRLDTIIKDEMAKGPATTNWGELPFFSMHKSGEDAGHRRASKAFVASLAQDLPNSGFAQGSVGYESALINAAYRSSFSDPMQRYHMLLSQGMLQQADLTHPDTALGKAIETDYKLMSQPWSRDFIKKGAGGTFVDFAGMREYAVETGLGKWTDKKGGNTAENFEFIDEELEKIEDKTKKTEKGFLDWHDTLKGVLGTLTAIGAITGAVKALETAYKASEEGTVNAGTELDKRRAFINMTPIEELKTKVASKAVGLGDSAIKDEIYNMAEKISSYKTFGDVDMLPASLLGAFDNLMSTDTPYETYLNVADELYNELKSKSPEERQEYLMYMQKAGLGQMGSVVGALLSNDAFAQKMGGAPSNLFDLSGNPYYNVYENAELLLPDIAKLNESLQASYDTMFLTWEKTFGLPFKTWWNDVMQERVVPWFQKIANYVSSGQLEEDIESTKEAYEAKKASKAFDKAWDKAVAAQQKANKSNRIEDLNLETGAWNIAANAAISIGGEYWQGLNISSDPIQKGKSKALVNELTKGIFDPDAAGQFDYKPSEFLAGLQILAGEGEYKNGVLKTDSRLYDPAAAKMHDKAVNLLAWLKQTGFEEQLTSNENTTTSYALIKVLKEFLATPGYYEGMSTLDSYLLNTYLQTPGWKDIIEPFLRNNAEYLRANGDKLMDIKIHLFDVYGTPINAKIDSIVQSTDPAVGRE